MIIIEGIDGVGKSALIEELTQYGYYSFHFEYESEKKDIFEKYQAVLNQNVDYKKVALDRSFISEMVYGPVLRGYCRLDKRQYKKLLNLYSKYNCKIIYLFASKEILKERRKNDKGDLSVINKHYDELTNKYKSILRISRRYLPTIIIDTSGLNRYDLIRHLMRNLTPNIYDLLFAGNISKDNVTENKVYEIWGGGAFHSSLSAAQIYNKRIAVLSAFGKDFDSSLLNKKGVFFFGNQKSYKYSNCFIINKHTHTVILKNPPYLNFPRINKFIETNNLHVSFRLGVPVLNIVNNKFIKYKRLSVDVMHTSIDWSIKLIDELKYKIEIIFCSYDEYCLLSNKSSPHITYIVTNEEKPLMIIRNNEVQHYLLIPVNDSVVLSVGAGDSFIGGFLSYFNGNNYREASINGISISQLFIATAERKKISLKDIELKKILLPI